MADTNMTGGAGRAVRRYLFLVFGTIAGLILFGFGMYWLIVGVAGGNFISLIAGLVVLGGLVAFGVRALRRSARMAQGERAGVEAREAAGMRRCPRCVTDFVLATAPTEPRPWWHLGATVAAGVLMTAAAGVVIAGLWVFDLGGADWSVRRGEYTVKLGLMFFAGLVVVAEAVRGRDRRRVRCPACGRACGTVAPPAARGFPVGTSAR
ncbi:MAG: hypothetical protein ACAI43_03025 [Phycisphaerae bacterium]